MFHGNLVDEKSRCIHYHLPLDIVAIKFACCGKFWACYKCHDENVTHDRQRWNPEQLKHEQVVQCGECKALLSFAEYSSGLECPKCNAAFNPRCLLHYPIYFEIE